MFGAEFPAMVKSSSKFENTHVFSSKIPFGKVKNRKKFSQILTSEKQKYGLDPNRWDRLKNRYVIAICMFGAGFRAMVKSSSKCAKTHMFSSKIPFEKVKNRKKFSQILTSAKQKCGHDPNRWDRACLEPNFRRW